MDVRFPVVVLVLVFTALVSGCATVPETGRSQLMLVSPAEEAQMALNAFEEIKKQEKISTDPARNARVQRVGTRIAAAVGRDLPDANWEFVVFESEQVNAFALAGGKVGVYTALMDLAESDDELAVVIGHEIAHVTSRHTGERLSQALLAQMGQMAVAIGAKDSSKREAYMMAFNVGAQLGLLAYGRDQERESDTVGLRFAAKAGYDPAAGERFWGKMAKLGGQRPPPWFSSHPAPEERIARLRELAVELKPVYEEALKARAGG